MAQVKPKQNSNLINHIFDLKGRKAISTLNNSIYIFIPLMVSPCNTIIVINCLITLTISKPDIAHKICEARCFSSAAQSFYYAAQLVHILSHFLLFAPFCKIF